LPPPSASPPATASLLHSLHIWGYGPIGDTSMWKGWNERDDESEYNGNGMEEERSARVFSPLLSMNRSNTIRRTRRRSLFITPLYRVTTTYVPYWKDRVVVLLPTHSACSRHHQHQGSLSYNCNLCITWLACSMVSSLLSLPPPSG